MHFALPSILKVANFNRLCINNEHGDPPFHFIFLFTKTGSYGISIKNTSLMIKLLGASQLNFILLMSQRKKNRRSKMFQTWLTGATETIGRECFNDDRWTDVKNL